MKKAFKIFSLGVIGILSLFMMLTKVDAANATINVYSSSSKVVTGNTFKVTVKISSSVPLGSWDYTLNYDSGQVSLINSDVALRYAGYGDGKIKSKSYSYTFKALKSGTAKFYISKSAVIDWDFNNLSVSNGSRNVTLITQAQLEASYSSNNNLSSLSVEGYELSPAFDKNTIAYSVTIPSTVTSIKINAKKADNTASVAGAGEFPVSEGLNTFEIKVTAQNGNVKTYTLNVTVEDLNPIIVKVNDVDYTIVKRKDLLTIPSTYTEASVTINEMEIPAFKSEVLNYTLVGLKDSEGNIKLYIYNESDNSYQEYKELSLNSIAFTPTEKELELEKYTKTTILVNKTEISAYKIDEKSDFAVIYGKNVETGEEGLYLFDSKENTLQRYYVEEVKELRKDIKEYLVIAISFSGCFLLAIGYILFTIFKNNKPKKEIKEIKEKKNKKAEKTIKEE